VSVWPGVGRMEQQSTVVLGQVSTVLASSGGHAGVWRRAKVVSKKLGGMGDMMEARVTAGSPPGRRGRRSMAQMGGLCSVGHNRPRAAQHAKPGVCRREHISSRSLRREIALVRGQAWSLGNRSSGWLPSDLVVTRGGGGEATVNTARISTLELGCLWFRCPS